MKKALIFDLDGTLLNTIYDITDCLNATLKKFGLKTHTYDETLKMVGRGAKYLVKAATNLDGEKFDEVYNDYVELQKNCKNEKTCIYDGMGELLKALDSEGYILAVVSNKPDSVAQVVKKDKFKGYNFAYFAGNKEGVPTKPDKGCVEHCLKEIGVEKDNAVYVGDSEVDVDTAKNAGVKCVGVLWGFREKSELLSHGCENFAATAKELYSIIKKEL